MIIPYQANSRLPGEHSSRIAHLDVIKSPLVKKLIDSFKNPNIPIELKDVEWEPLSSYHETLKYIFGVDGSYQIVNSDISPYSSIAFVKTALIKMDIFALSRVDKENPHPLILKTF